MTYCRCRRPRLRLLVAGFVSLSVLFAVTLPAQTQKAVPGVPKGVTAFENVTVVPMDSERVLTEHTVLIDGGRITAVGPSARVTVPRGAFRIDARGQYLMPGLSDCHVHIGYGLSGSVGLSLDNLVEYRLLQWLADGVTTIRNLDYMDRPETFQLKGTDLLGLRARAAAGELWSPRIYTAGQWGPGHYTNFDATFGKKKDLPEPNLDSVTVYVAAYKAAGYDFLKIHEETPAVFAAVLAAARRVGMPVVGHVPQGALLEQALAGGMQSIEHMTGYPSDEGVSDSQAQALAAATRRAGVWNCVNGGGTIRPKIIRALQDTGVGLLLGSDFPFGLGGVHYELEQLVQKAGLTRYEALATGTKHFGAYLRTLDSTGGEVGTIAVGKRADLVLLEGNPLADITHVKRPVGVMIGGRWLVRAALDQRLVLAAPRSWLMRELVFSGIRGSTKEQRGQINKQTGKLRDLSDSLAAAKSRSAEYERLVQRLAAEFGVMRAILPPAQHAAFDPIAQAWWRVQTGQGHRVTIPGMAPPSLGE